MNDLFLLVAVLHRPHQEIDGEREDSGSEAQKIFVPIYIRRGRRTTKRGPHGAIILFYQEHRKRAKKNRKNVRKRWMPGFHNVRGKPYWPKASTAGGDSRRGCGEIVSSDDKMGKDEDHSDRLLAYEKC